MFLMLNKAIETPCHYQILKIPTIKTVAAPLDLIKEVVECYPSSLMDLKLQNPCYQPDLMHHSSNQ